jgi:hypothetical protein
MGLELKHLLYPEALNPGEVVSMIQATLDDATANRDVWDDPRFDWANFIYRICLEYGINPAWPLISLQREQSLLSKPGTPRAFQFANGVVGQDAPGTANNLWSGLPNQIFLSVRSMAWSLNVGPAAAFGCRPGLYPTWRRWGQSQSVILYDLQTHKPQEPAYLCAVPEDYGQLLFTPHLEVIPENANILASNVKRFL